MENNFNLKEVAAKTLIIQPHPVIIIEGLFTFYYPKIDQLMNIKIFLEAPKDVMLKGDSTGIYITEVIP